ncbi:MAG TPA: hypothetical protein VOA80_10135, partial [Thermoanaerobaculia bacterium]|nr:hypothetical protein [Thermoanaerobaculia bacterium]
HLAILAAAGSNARGTRLFEDQPELARLLSVLENRNELGHYVTTPNALTARSLSEKAASLLDRLCSHLGSTLTVREIETWLAPPSRFLEY